MKRIVGFGLVNHDTVACAEYVALDSKVRATQFFEQVGGPVPVALQCAVRLGRVSATHLGVIGRDSLGDDLRARLVRTGVEPNLRIGGPSTSRSIVLLDTANGTRIVANYAEGLTPYPFDEEANQTLSSANLLHLDGRDRNGSLTAAQIVRSHGGLVSLDLGTMRPGLEELFSYCDIVLASRKGGSGAFPEFADDPCEQVSRFLDLGANVAGVTLGENGLALGWRDGGRPRFLPALRATRVVDTCGAGDTFHGAFLWSYLHDADPMEAAAFAQATVCVRIGRFGNEAGLPTEPEVRAFREGL